MKRPTICIVLSGPDVQADKTLIATIRACSEELSRVDLCGLRSCLLKNDLWDAYPWDDVTNWIPGGPDDDIVVGLQVLAGWMRDECYDIVQVTVTNHPNDKRLAQILEVFPDAVVAA